MAGNDFTYFYRRAGMELERARQATDAKAAEVHQQLADAYFARASSVATGGAPKYVEA